MNPSHITFNRDEPIVQDVASDETRRWFLIADTESYDDPCWTTAGDEVPPHLRDYELVEVVEASDYDRLREALEQILDPLEAAVDPEWATTIARFALQLDDD